MSPGSRSLRQNVGTSSSVQGPSTFTLSRLQVRSGEASKRPSQHCACVNGTPQTEAEPRIVSWFWTQACPALITPCRAPFRPRIGCSRALRSCHHPGSVSAGNLRGRVASPPGGEPGQIAGACDDPPGNQASGSPIYCSPRSRTDLPGRREAGGGEGPTNTITYRAQFSCPGTCHMAGNTRCHGGDLIQDRVLQRSRSG